MCFKTLHPPLSLLFFLLQKLNFSFWVTCKEVYLALLSVGMKPTSGWHRTGSFLPHCAKVETTIGEAEQSSGSSTLFHSSKRATRFAVEFPPWYSHRVLTNSQRSDLWVLLDMDWALSFWCIRLEIHSSTVIFAVWPLSSMLQKSHQWPLVLLQSSMMGRF